MVTTCYVWCRTEGCGEAHSRCRASEGHHQLEAAAWPTADKTESGIAHPLSTSAAVDSFSEDNSTLSEQVEVLPLHSALLDFRGINGSLRYP